VDIAFLWGIASKRGAGRGGQEQHMTLHPSSSSLTPPLLGLSGCRLQQVTV
jgi:hypothetical protein